MPYSVPRSEWPGDAPPQAQGHFVHLSALLSAYQLSQAGFANLSELSVGDLQLSLGVLSEQGDYLRVPISQGSSAEGVMQGYATGVDIAGEGAGSLGLVDKPADTYGGPTILTSLGEVTYDPTRPFVEGAIPENAASKDPEKGQTTTSHAPDEQTLEPVTTVNNQPNPYGEPEEVKPVIGESWDG